MTNSQNGYKAGDTSLIANYTIPGSAVKINLRKGDVSVVLLHFAAWFNAHIQPLRQSDTGGYNYRPIAGSKTVSNHGSGTAEDLRWNDHPLGAVGTFSRDQASRIREQLKYYSGVIRWGGDYTGRKDEMHFEINKPPAAVKVIADKIRNDAKPARVPATMNLSVTIPELRQGDDDAKLGGPNLINRIQGLLGITRDGVWGPKTTAAIAQWMHLPTAQCDELTEPIYRSIFGAPK